MKPAAKIPRPPARDLGALKGPVMICGGANSNLEAFSAMLTEAGRRGIDRCRIIHTGDVIAYCADAQGTAEALRSSGIASIRGNVEAQLASDDPDCGCGFEADSVCSLLSRQWYGYARNAISPDIRRWMGSLPEALTFRFGGRNIRVVHGGVTEVSRYIFASMPDEVFNQELDAAEADVVIGGHSGLAFTRAVERRIWHNSGALGMPANDGTPRVWVSVLHRAGDGIDFEFVPLTYDARAAARKMRARALPEEYARALETGLWPSLDVMPAHERGLTGVRLAGTAARPPERAGVD